MIVDTNARRTAGDHRADPYAGRVRVQHSAAYDLLVSLRALYNPRTYDAARVWARRVAATLPDEFSVRARFFFSGFDTAFGYAGARLIPALPDGASPEDLIAAIRGTDARDLAMTMLDTGETTAASLAVFRAHLDTGVPKAGLDRALRGLSAEWARRCRKVLGDPVAAQRDYATLLENYLEWVFRAEVPFVSSVTEEAARVARQLLGVLPTVDALERLAGGYTLGEDLDLVRITIAPSLFVYPFMSSRVDEGAREALIIYGVASDAFSRHDPLHVDPTLTRVLKALADPSRLRLMRLLSQREMFGSEIVTALGLTQPTVHHHLAELRAARLIRQERAKGGMRYSVRREAVRDQLQALEQLISQSE